MLLLSTLEKGILEDQGGQQYLRKCLSLQTRQRGSHLKKKPTVSLSRPLKEKIHTLEILL